MATTHQDTNVNSLVINKLTKQEYDNLSQVSETELYLVEEQVDSAVTQGSTNPVQSGAVYNALQDIGSSINDGTTWFIKNNQTVGIISANQALDKIIKIPNDIVMCKMSDGIVYDSYITYTKIKQYLPDYPYYSDDLNWEIGGNPPMRASITEGNYYLDVDTNHIFVADENLELLDITSSVVIHGDTNKLYCNVDDNKLYRYDGSNFVALTSNFSGSYNDLKNKPLSVINNQIQYTAGSTVFNIPRNADNIIDNAILLWDSNNKMLKAATKWDTLGNSTVTLSSKCASDTQFFGRVSGTFNLLICQGYISLKEDMASGETIVTLPWNVKPGHLFWLQGTTPKHIRVVTPNKIEAFENISKSSYIWCNHSVICLE